MAKHAPAGLEGESRRLFLDVTNAYDLMPHQLKILESACVCWQRILNYRKEIEEHGTTTIDRYGQVKEHPSVTAERQYMSLFYRLCRELGLHVDASDSRPPTLY